MQRTGSGDREHAWGLGVILLQHSGGWQCPRLMHLGGLPWPVFFYRYCSVGESQDLAWAFHKSFGTFPPALQGIIHWPWRAAPVVPQDLLHERLLVK